MSEMDSWTARVRAIKAGNPQAKVLATFHATEIWLEDISAAHRWLPPKCLMRNKDGSACTWWKNLVFTNNLFQPECLQAAVDNALRPLPALIAAGVDGVFLGAHSLCLLRPPPLTVSSVVADGVIPFNYGCNSGVDVNCTCVPSEPTGRCNCTDISPSPAPSIATLEAAWIQLYIAWFEALKAKHPQLLWINNIDTTIAEVVMNVSNGRQIEGSYNDPGSPGLNSIIDGTFPISTYIAAINEWEERALKPTLVHVSVNSLIAGNWRVGRWQNLATKGEMMLRITHFARMRFGLGVALMSNAYFANDIGGGFYGVPPWYTEYENDLGAATHDASVIFESPTGETVWARQFEKGYVIVNSLSSSNFTLKLQQPMKVLPRSKNVSMLTDQREAPYWQLILDNDFNAPPPPAPSRAPLRRGATPMQQCTAAPEIQSECVCSAASPACCPKPEGRAMDWWAEPARRAKFFIPPGSSNWTVITDADAAESRQLGASFAVSFNIPGPFPQGDPPQFAAGWRFVSPSTDYYSFSLTKVQAHMYQLTDGALVCVRKANTSAGGACIAKGEVDQCNSVRDGGWQRALSHVPLAFNESYEFVLSWDSSRGGYALIDALLIESETLYNGGDGTPITEVTVGAVDARILLKSDDAQASFGEQTACQFGLLELSVPAPQSTSTSNYDCAQTPVATFTHAQRLSTAITVSSFLYQNFTRAFVNDREVLTPLGTRVFLVRFAPPTVGLWHFTVQARDGKVLRDGTLEVTTCDNRSSSDGWVRASPSGQHFALSQTNRSLFPVGENVAMPSKTNGTFAMEAYLRQLLNHSANAFRLWLGPQLVNNTIGWPKCAGTFSGPSFCTSPLILETLPRQYSLENAWRADWILRFAQDHGMYVHVSLDSWPQETKGGEWNVSVYNSANGGHCGAEPWDMFSQLTGPCAAQWEQRHRYVGARFGAFTSILGLEIGTRQLAALELCLPNHFNTWWLQSMKSTCPLPRPSARSLRATSQDGTRTTPTS